MALISEWAGIQICFEFAFRDAKHCRSYSKMFLGPQNDTKQKRSGCRMLGGNSLILDSFEPNQFLFQFTMAFSSVEGGDNVLVAYRPPKMRKVFK